MKILVCGGRESNQQMCNQVWCTLDDHLTAANNAGQKMVIITGGATGADSYANDWAYANDVPCKVFRADWKKHGRAAGPIRNKQMIVEGKPDLVLAFPGGKGTANMVKQAQEHGIEVEVTT